MEVFPSFLPNIELRKDIRAMEVISNLEDVKNLEFDSNYITDLIEKFSITPITENRSNTKFFN